ncbi:MAG: nuclear transport factor 2 family protein [Fimbriiglobus sp.]
MTRRILAVFAGLVLAAPTRADDAAAVKEIETALKELNAAFETGTPAAITKLMTDNHGAVTPWAGRQTRDEQIKTLPDLKLTAYKPGKMTITLIGADGALVTYPLAMTGTFRGNPVPADSHAAAVWVRRGGAWKELYYQETAATK